MNKKIYNNISKIEIANETINNINIINTGDINTTGDVNISITKGTSQNISIGSDNSITIDANGKITGKQIKSITQNEDSLAILCRNNIINGNYGYRHNYILFSTVFSKTEFMEKWQVLLFGVMPVYTSEQIFLPLITINDDTNAENFIEKSQIQNIDIFGANK